MSSFSLKTINFNYLPLTTIGSEIIAIDPKIIVMNFVYINLAIYFNLNIIVTINITVLIFLQEMNTTNLILSSLQ